MSVITDGTQARVAPGEPMKIEVFLVCVVAALLVYRLWLWLLEWFRRAPVTPDPWDASVAQAIEDPDCPVLCHRCLTPQQHMGWFCPECGATVGPYANCLPFIYIFSEGEVLRNGVSQHVRWSALTVIGYVLFSVITYAIFAPVYLYWLFKNVRRDPPAEESPEASPPG